MSLRSDRNTGGTPDGFSNTSYVAITGAESTDGRGYLRGVIGFDRGLSVNEITDGTSNTLLVGEVTDGGPWFAGGSGTARPIDDWIEKKTWSPHASGGNFAFADGSVTFISSALDPRTLRGLATAQGGESVSPEGGEAALADANSRELTAPGAANSRPHQHLQCSRPGRMVTREGLPAFEDRPAKKERKSPFPRCRPPRDRPDHPKSSPAGGTDSAAR